ncbi:hypothetical protein D9619_000791 [Psilocybe cf. subviscida]|uniref:Exonuclease domain-containing protein n=1 Tax=Psilocybe cf. subviscida TaxID=2480587 RepID=A0A8H5BFL0_9AGAR|nr:hypothetical protein D9619_000791 [Psilocybe cf. subviscida]
MFTTLGLFNAVACPDRDACTRSSCLLSHSPDLPQPRGLARISVAPSPSPSSSKPPPATPLKESVVPAKRPALISPVKAYKSAAEPPRKLQKVGPAQRPSALPGVSYTESGVPILRINAAQSLVAVPVRQTMLKTLYEHFVTLYSRILSSNATIASEHAVRQEDEVYKRSTKVTYRHAVIQCVAALKRRPAPTDINHPSVGTEADLVERAETQKSLNALRLSSDILKPLIHSVSDLEKWGYIVNIPPGVGGDLPSMLGRIVKCDRCVQYYLVKPLEETETCIYHWGRPYTTKSGGEKVRTYSCCSRPVSDSEGCSHGPHVFYESKPEDLHSRHAFSFLPAESPTSTVLDVVAMDCEMIYTTGGLRVARVSVVDGSGKEIFDTLVKMDDDVHVIDFNTRFSGITPEGYATAVDTLSRVRERLHALMDVNTILIGHALDNDLKTLRIIHHRCIDTALLFPHKAGPPYRRSLKDLVREKLGKMIQTGDATEGHSSVEDASATLDLVRWYILNKQKSAIQAGVNGVSA